MRFNRPTIFCILSLCLLWQCSSPQPDIHVGATLPSFSVKDLQGKRFTQKDLANDVTILNFWATWCQPCRTEMPTLNKIQQTGTARVLGISLDEGGPTAVQKFLEKEPLAYTILMGDQQTFQRFQGLAIPYTLIISPSHQIVAIHSGPVSFEDLQRDIAKAREAG